jgi:hypothetical protein
MLGALTMVPAGCSERATGPSLADPYQRWKSYGLHDYAIDQMRSCFCSEGGEVMRIVVRADTIASITRVSDGSALGNATKPLYHTIDSLFSIIHTHTTDSLVVRYDERYGYPETLDINPQLHPVDGGVLYATTNLRVPS